MVIIDYRISLLACTMIGNIYLQNATAQYREYYRGIYLYASTALLFT